MVVAACVELSLANMQNGKGEGGGSLYSCHTAGKRTEKIQKEISLALTMCNYDCLQDYTSGCIHERFAYAEWSWEQ